MIIIFLRKIIINDLELMNISLNNRVRDLNINSYNDLISLFVIKIEFFIDVKI